MFTACEQCGCDVCKDPKRWLKNIPKVAAGYDREGSNIEDWGCDKFKCSELPLVRDSESLAIYGIETTQTPTKPAASMLRSLLQDARSTQRWSA